MRWWLLCAAIGLVALSATASPLPDYPFLFVTGSAEKALPPDMAQLRFTVATRNLDAKVAASAVESTLASVVAILSKASIRQADIDASAVNKTPLRHWETERGRSIPDGYEVSRTISVTSRNLATYPEMIQALLDLPNTESFSVEFGRSDREKVETELFALAAQSGTQKAEVMAGQFGRKLGPVHAIARVPFDDLPEAFGFGRNGSVTYGPPYVVTSARKSMVPMVPAAITISESVNVIFELQ